MATVGVLAVGPLTDGDLSPGIFRIITVQNESIVRTGHQDGLEIETLVLVDEVNLIPSWVSGSWKVTIPSGTTVVVRINNVLKIAETAQPIQVSGPTISIRELES